MGYTNETYEKVELFVPNHKTGFKILKDEQLSNIFPTYQMLFDKIRYHREKLNEHERIKGLDSQYNLMYDNIYSIMGKRGSGKTSVIFTLKKKIEMDYPSDIVLPVIMPEMITDNETILGWILAILEDIVKELEGKIKSNWNMRENDKFFRNCKFVENNKLRCAYDKVKELYFSRQFNNHNTESLAMAIGNSETQTLNSFQFAKELAIFWDVLVDTIVECESEKYQKNPLIYLMFDDVDLTPNKVTELLSTIIKYLAHPNLVVILTADEELFYEVMENDFAIRMKGSQKSKIFAIQSNTILIDNYHNNIGEYSNQNDIKVEETAKLYMDKIMPPSSRYYLEEFNTCRKRRMFIETVQTSNQDKHYRNLEDFLRGQVNEYIKVRRGLKNFSEYKNFLYYQGKKEEFLQSYFLFWGNTSRQLVNECFMVSDLFDNLKKLFVNVKGKKISKKQYLEHVHEHILNFVKNSINVNMKLRRVVTDINQLSNELCLQNKNQWSIYINYRSIERFYNRKIEEAKEEEEQKEVLESVVAIFVLMFFVENILLIGDEVKDCWSISVDRDRVHGVTYLVDLLDDALATRISIVRNTRDKDAVSELLNNYEDILANPQWLHVFSFSRYSDVKDYLYPLYTKEVDYEIGIKDLYKWNAENPLWFKGITTMIYLMYSGIYAIKGRELRLFRWEEKMQIYDSYLLYMISRGIEDMKSSLGGANQIENSTDLLYRYEQRNKIIRDASIEEEFEEIFVNVEKLDDPKYSIKHLREQLLECIKENDYIRTLVFSEWGNIEDVFSIYCLLREFENNTIIWKASNQTKEYVRNTIERLREELIQKYTLFNFYYVENKDEVLQSFDRIKGLNVSWELLNNIEQMTYEIKMKEKIKTSTLNKTMECLNKEIKNSMQRSNNIGYYIDRRNETLQACKYILTNNLGILLESKKVKNDELSCELDLGVSIIIKHEALFQLQRIYLYLLLDEAREEIKQQGIKENSFYEKYLRIMRTIIFNKGEGKHEEKEITLYLRKIIRNITEEAIEDYFAFQFSILAMGNGERDNG